MKLFKTVDRKLAEIGFTKEKEDKYGCVYKRKDKEYNFTQKAVGCSSITAPIAKSISEFPRESIILSASINLLI